MPELTGKTVLLTGALGTLGRAQADRLARAGAGLLLLDRPGAAGGDAFAAGVAAAHGVPATYIGEDLNDLAGAASRVAALSDEYDGIDILINNAALIINKPFEDFSLTEYEDQIRVNSSAAFALARAVAPAMRPRKPTGPPRCLTPAGTTTSKGLVQWSSRRPPTIMTR